MNIRNEGAPNNDDESANPILPRPRRQNFSQHISRIHSRQNDMEYYIHLLNDNACLLFIDRRIFIHACVL